MQTFFKQQLQELPTIALIEESGVAEFSVVGTTQHKGIPIFSPKGIHSLPSTGDHALLLSVEGAELCVGFLQTQEEIAPGELLLYSSGGAKIHLKNDGSVVINGLTITTEGKLIPKP